MTDKRAKEKAGSHTLKKAVTVLLVPAILNAYAFACMAVYIGSNLTDDGSTIFARPEEYTSDEGWPNSDCDIIIPKKERLTVYEPADETNDDNHVKTRIDR